MTDTKKRYGYTGKGARINLTTGKITVEPTLPRFQEVLGGTGIGYKVLFEEVPPGTSFDSPENKVIIAPGPISGTGAICSGRTAMTCLWPTSWPQSLVASAHVGGELAHKMKFAGWDFFIIEGEAKSPCYIYVNNDKIEIRDAHFIWNQGTRRAAAALSHEIGDDYSIGVIGPAGENLVPMSNMMVDKSHSAGGVGGIFGRKKMKAIVVRGDQAIHIHATPEEWEALIDSHRAILGAHTQTVVPEIPMPLFEYHAARSRWNGVPGRVWGAANPPVVLTDDVRDVNHIAYRTCSAPYYMGNSLWNYHVRTTGCYACPIRCYSVVRDDETAAKYNINPITEQTCMALYGRWWFPSLVADTKKPVSREACLVGTQVMDDLGIWCNYGCLQRDFRHFHTKGYWKKFLSEEEYKSIDWSKIDNPDPMILKDILNRIAYRKGEFGFWLGETTPKLLEHFGVPESEWQNTKSTAYWNCGHPKHHANEDDGQVGCVLNCLYNRDPMAHGTVNFTRSSLPIHEQKRIAAHFWESEDAVDAIGDYKPTNIYKMKRLLWVIARKELHDMLGFCSWASPWELSPLKERNYIGDIEMESKVFRAVTGINMSQDELDHAGRRAFVLERAYTQLQLKTKNMRQEHDKYPEWILHDKDKKPFTKGTIRMDRDDMEKSFDMFYELMGFDVQTGGVTEKCLKDYQLDYVIPVMKSAGLL
ncbi:aldehyde ferredoxin oxidoreductase N-terminal domain-containing protein [Sutterella sp.]|uniref:aldehyde ferredoxin oxidoreductase N-terminal domain-containing protein n=1 Tax=Sutterella sp. TaxID=1981025 RepID=UPI0026DF1DDF|nr:aldehyde ferredoxin oxidoreductase N-terminal domain-containing protein [Sutterella sp.]MDO5530580.1 aldehyde ferredoxin oxidoreductase N-terminal domain-containing protein [Sutterella sp.]